MNNGQLTASGGQGSQTATQNPQTVGASNLSRGQSSNSVQSGTPTAALNSSSTTGIPLSSTKPTVVNTPASVTKTSATTAKPAPTPHKNTPLGTGLSIIFIIVALVLVGAAVRPVKNTTD